MRDFKKLTAIFGGIIAAAGLAAVGLVACSDDTDIGGTDAASEVSTADVVTTDTNPPDPDGGPPDAEVDGPTLLELPPAIDEAICKRVLACCGEGGGADSGVFDGGVFDMAACLKSYGGAGWDNSLVGTEVPGVVDGGHLVYDKVQANTCLTSINNGGTFDGGKFTCGVMPAAELKAISTACFAAVRGNIPIGTAGCRATIECVPGSYCAAAGGGSPPPLGATGTCTAIKAVGANCDDSAPQAGKYGNDECSYRGSGEACIRPDAGLPRTCAALRATGSACQTTNEECQTGLCDDNGFCGTSVTFITQPFCKQFVDGGN